jgi:hydrogenase maturation protease
MRVLVAGIGNLFCGDDGFGPEVVRRLVAADTLPEWAHAVDYGIRGMHLAYDLLEEHTALVIVDVVPGLPSDGAPGALRVLQVTDEDLGGGELDPHGMAPVAVLGSLRGLGGSLPETYVVGCTPQDTGDRIGLSPAVEAAVPRAMSLVETLLAGRVADLGVAATEVG